MYSTYFYGTFFQVFMILMKNNDHVTFLHVYHHTIMVLSSWFTLRYAEGKGHLLELYVFKTILYM